MKGRLTEEEIWAVLRCCTATIGGVPGCYDQLLFARRVEALTIEWVRERLHGYGSLEDPMAGPHAIAFLGLRSGTSPAAADEAEARNGSDGLPKIGMGGERLTRQETSEGAARNGMDSGAQRGVSQGESPGQPRASDPSPSDSARQDLPQPQADTCQGCGYPLTLGASAQPNCPRCDTPRLGCPHPPTRMVSICSACGQSTEAASGSGVAHGGLMQNGGRASGGNAQTMSSGGSARQTATAQAEPPCSTTKEVMPTDRTSTPTQPDRSVSGPELCVPATSPGGVSVGGVQDAAEIERLREDLLGWAASFSGGRTFAGPRIETLASLARRLAKEHYEAVVAEAQAMGFLEVMEEQRDEARRLAERFGPGEWAPPWRPR